MRPQTHPRPAPSEATPRLSRCPHPGSRIVIEVTSDLGFEYCPLCDQKSWWRRSRDGVPDALPRPLN
jgi:hypothetical protein